MQKVHRLASCLILAFLLPLVCPAQSAATGAIAGRIFNPATGKYVRNAEVRIAGSDMVAASEDGGYYKLDDVPPGVTTIAVAFTGYHPATATLNVTAGQTATHDFELSSSLDKPGTDPAVVQLGAFVVSSEREGNAKAIMSQRNSMNVTNSVSSDAFGDYPEGNVGDFVKNLPGVELELVEGIARTPRLRGLGAEYTQVMIDGVSLASADANLGAAGNARSFSFEQVSLSSIESVEISKTVSADVDANAPAGTINLRTKRAFDREGRRISWQANLSGYSANMGLGRSYGPDDQRHHKTFPGGSFEYSDQFLDRRLGVLFSMSESKIYSESNGMIIGYNYVPTAAVPARATVSSLTARNGPRTIERFTTTLTTDFKATPRLILSLGLMYNWSEQFYFNRQVSFNPIARANIVGANPLVDFATTGGTTVNQTNANVDKLGTGWTMLPNFEYRRGDFLIEGKLAYSDSISDYQPLTHAGAVFQATSTAPAGVTIRATRSSPMSADWTIVQTGGPDWSDPASFRNPQVVVDDGRYGRTRVWSAEVAATIKTKTLLPIVWKTGVKEKIERREYETKREAFSYAYIGPGGGANGSWAGFASPYQFDMTMMDVNLISLSGRSFFQPNAQAIGRLFKEHPEYFAPNFTATNFYNAYIDGKKDYTETTDAAYVMGTTTINRLRLRAGLRWEGVETDSLEFALLPAAQVIAAGYTVANTGRATTIDGIRYQYYSRARVHRKGNYDRFFPSVSAKYNFARNLEASLGFSTTIRRPTFRDIAGVWTIDDVADTVTAPNPRLLPEKSKNISTRLAYYFEPVGMVAIHFYQNRVRGQAITNRLTAQEYGYTGQPPSLETYTFITNLSSANEITTRGMELEYSQSLSFLPRPFKGLGVFANYTRNYASELLPQLIPHSVKGGLNYTLGRFSFRTNAGWIDNYFNNVAGTLYMRHRTVVDAGVNVGLTRRFGLFLSVQDVFNARRIGVQHNPGNPALVNSPYGRYGTQYTLGVKGGF